MEDSLTNDRFTVILYGIKSLSVVPGQSKHGVEPIEKSLRRQVIDRIDAGFMEKQKAEFRVTDLHGKNLGWRMYCTGGRNSGRMWLTTTDSPFPLLLQQRGLTKGRLH